MAKKNGRAFTSRLYQSWERRLAAGVGSGPFFCSPNALPAEQKTLKISVDTSVPAYDTMFDGTFCSNMGQKHARTSSSITSPC